MFLADVENSALPTIEATEAAALVDF